MQFLIHQQMNIMSAAVLLLFGVYAFSMLDKKSSLNKIYLASLFLNLLLIILDILLNFLIETENISLFYLRSTGVLLYLLSPVFAYLFLQFICLYIFGCFKIKKMARNVFAALIIVNSITTFYVLRLKNFKTRTVSEFSVPFILMSVFLIYSVYVIVKNKKLLLSFEYTYIFTMSIITNAMILSQIIFNNTLFVWCGLTLTIIFMYIVLQQRELYRDSLTGARNRLVLKKCFEMYAKKSNNRLSAVLIDLDYFKNINDSYGHMEGDNALKTFVRLLHRVYREKGVVIRMGGDEFLVLLNNIPTEEVNQLILKMEKLVDMYNIKGDKPYRIKYSCASGTYKNDVDLEEFLHEIDIKMYRDKLGRKNKFLSLDNL